LIQKKKPCCKNISRQSNKAPETCGKYKRVFSSYYSFVEREPIGQKRSSCNCRAAAAVVQTKLQAVTPTEHDVSHDATGGRRRYPTARRTPSVFVYHVHRPVLEDLLSSCHAAALDN